MKVESRYGNLIMKFEEKKEELLRSFCDVLDKPVSKIRDVEILLKGHRAELFYVVEARKKILSDRIFIGNFRGIKEIKQKLKGRGILSD